MTWSTIPGLCDEYHQFSKKPLSCHIPVPPSKEPPSLLLRPGQCVVGSCHCQAQCFRNLEEALFLILPPFPCTCHTFQPTFLLLTRSMGPMVALHPAVVVRSAPCSRQVPPARSSTHAITLGLWNQKVLCSLNSQNV